MLFGGARDFYVLKNVVTKSGYHSASHLMGVGKYNLKGVKQLEHGAHN